MRRTQSPTPATSGRELGQESSRATNPAGEGMGRKLHPLFPTGASRPRAATDAIRQVRLGQTPPRDIEQQFGAADERTADGGLVYRFETTRLRGGQMQTEAETVTFRF